MNYKDGLKAEVLKRVLEGVGQVGHPVGASATANGHYPVDDQEFQGELPDEEPNMHDDDPNAEEDALDTANLLLGKKLDEAPMKKAGEKKVTFSIPKFVPSEAWGDAKEESRQDIYKFFKKIPGRTLGKKIENINAIASRTQNVRSTAKILATLVFFDSLSSVVKDFTPASSGFVFEGFLAALLNGSQEIERSAGGTLDIADIRALQRRDSKGNLDASSGYPISLKLLTGAGTGTPIHGSYPNLIGSLADSDDDSMLYVVVLKDRAEKANELQFHEFDVNAATFLPIMSEGKNNKRHLPLHGSILKNKKFQALSTAPIQSLAKMVDDSGYLPLDVSMNIIDNDLTPIKSDSNEFFNMMKYTKGFFEKHGTGKRGEKEAEVETEPVEQDNITERMSQGSLGFLFEGAAQPFQFSVSQARMKKLPTYQNMGTIDVRPENIKKIAESYADILEKQLNQVYDNLKSLTTSVNDYFLGEDYGERVTAADAAIESAKVSKKQATTLKQKAGDENEEV